MSTTLTREQVQALAENEGKPLPVLDPERITVPTLIMRGQWDGIASFQDLASFFGKLPNPDKQFVVMPGIAHTSTRSKNWSLVYHLLDAYFSQPAPVYVG